MLRIWNGNNKPWLNDLVKYNGIYLIVKNISKDNVTLYDPYSNKNFETKIEKLNPAGVLWWAKEMALNFEKLMQEKYNKEHTKFALVKFKE